MKLMEKEAPEIQDFYQNKKIYKIYLQEKDSTIIEGNPHFFIKIDPNDKRYRISTSFDFMNKKWGFNINIIRDLSKLEIQEDQLKKIIKECELTRTLCKPGQQKIFQPSGSEESSTQEESSNFIDIFALRSDCTFIFLIERFYEGSKNSTLVFFSTQYFNFNEFVDCNNLKECL